MRALTLFRDEERAQGRRYRGFANSSQLMDAFGRLDNAERQSYLLRAQGFVMESQQEDVVAPTSNKDPQPKIDTFLKDQLARSKNAPGQTTQDTMHSFPADCRAAQADDEETLPPSTQDLLQSRSSWWDNSRAWGVIDGLPAGSKNSLPVHLSYSEDPFEDAQPRDYDSPLTVGDHTNTLRCAVDANVGGAFHASSSARAGNMSPLSDEEGALAQEAIAGSSVTSDTRTPIVLKRSQPGDIAEHAPSGFSTAPWHQTRGAGLVVPPMGATFAWTLNSPSSTPYAVGIVGANMGTHSQSTHPFSATLGAQGAHRGIVTNTGAAHVASPLPRASAFGQRFWAGGAPIPQSQLPLQAAFGQAVGGFEGLPSDRKRSHGQPPQGSSHQEVSTVAPHQGITNATVSFPPSALPLSVVQQGGSFNPALVAPGTFPPGLANMVRSAMDRLEESGGKGGGVHIMRSLASLPGGARPTKEVILGMASTLPHGGPLLRHESMHRQLKTLPHGDFQITTPCGKAHVKVHMTSGSVDLCGSEPQIAVPYVEGWTLDIAVPSRRKKRPRGT